MLKRILVPLDPSEYSTNAVKYATYIAKKQNAETTGMVIYDIPGIEKSIGSYPTGGLYWAEKLEDAKKEKAKEEIDFLLNKFKEYCRKEEVQFSETEVQGTPSKMILEEAKFYDLLVLGQKTFFHFESQESEGDSLEKILHYSITPILTVPEKFNPIKNVLVAYDGSHTATRALKRFAHLTIAKDFNIKIIMGETNLEEGNYILQKAKDYLNAYGITNVSTEWTPEKIIDIIEEKYKNWADLFVTGMHSKKGLIYFLVGSLPKYLINNIHKPVFIGQ